MKKLFVKLKEALALKELGFNEQCFGIYENNTLANPSVFLHIRYDDNPVIPEEHKSRPAMFKTDNRNSVSPEWMVSAPTYQQAFNWFREKFKIESRIVNDENGYSYSIHKKGGKYPYTITMSIRKKYEASELDCLKQLIEIVKEEKKKKK